MKKIIPFFTIALNTFDEVLCVPVYLLFSAAALALIGLLPHISCFAFGEETKLVSDSVLSIAFLSGIFISAVSAGISVGNEYRKKTVFLILSKPVSRITFLLGKYAGVCMAITMFFLLAYASGCVALKLIGLLSAAAGGSGSGGCAHCQHATFSLAHLFYYVSEELVLSIAYFFCFIIAFIVGGIANYRFGRNFSFWAFVSMCILLLLLFAVLFMNASLDEIVMFTNFAMVGFLILLALFMISAVTVVFAMHFDVLFCIMASVSVLLIGLVADYIFGSSEFLPLVVLYRMLPNWQFFWMADNFSEGVAIPVSYVLECMLYCGIYSATVLGTGLFFDSRRDVA